MPSKRPETFHTKMTREEKDGWMEFADRHNVSASGLAQALGEVLGDWDIEASPTLHLPTLVDRAAELTRLSRRRPHLRWRDVDA